MGSKALALFEGLTRWWGGRRVATTADFESMAMVLLSGKGEASGVATGLAPARRLRCPARAEQRRFFTLLATRFGPNLASVRDAVADFLQVPDASRRRACTSSRNRAARS